MRASLTSLSEEKLHIEASPVCVWTPGWLRCPQTVRPVSDDPEEKSFPLPHPFYDFWLTVLICPTKGEGMRGQSRRVRLDRVSSSHLLVESAGVVGRGETDFLALTGRPLR